MSEQKKTINRWLVAGIILSLVTILATVFGINSSPVVLLDTAGVTEAAEQTMEFVRIGDFENLRTMLSGNPELEEIPEKSQDAESLIWYAYLESMEYEVSEECRASGSGMEVDVSIRCLDIAAVTESLQALVPTLMNQTDASRASEEEVAAVLSDAAAQILEKECPMTEQNITLQLIRFENRWQVLPTDMLQQLLSGFVSV